MKKTIILLLVVIIVLGVVLTGCSNGEKNTEIKPDTEVTGTDEASEKQEEKEETKLVVNSEMVNQKVAELEEAFPDIDVDIEIIKQLATDIEEYKTIDVEPVPDRNGNILKYKVCELDDEYIDDSSGAYFLSYCSEADFDDILTYFHMLLSGTEDFGVGMFVEGEYIFIGHLRGMKVDASLSDEGDCINVQINCFE